MSWYYADAGRQVGPVEESSLDELVRSGVVRDDTLVWREGMANWQPHSIARGARPPVPIPAVPIAADSGFCSECGRPFPASQLVAIGNASVCATCKPVYLQRVREGGQAIGTRHYGGFWIRFVARIIDLVIVSVALSIITIPLGALFGVGLLGVTDPLRQGAAFATIVGLYLLLSVVINFLYEVYFVSSRGGTPGKLILSLKIVHPDGSLLTVGQAVGRFFAYMLNAFTFYIGFIMAAFDDEKRALHDRIMNSRVIYTK
jgi:uncharacterized RDD family membrane protein YckC